MAEEHNCPYYGRCPWVDGVTKDFDELRKEHREDMNSIWTALGKVKDMVIGRWLLIGILLPVFAASFWLTYHETQTNRDDIKKVLVTVTAIATKQGIHVNHPDEKMR